MNYVLSILGKVAATIIVYLVLLEHFTLQSHQAQEPLHLLVNVLLDLLQGDIEAILIAYHAGQEQYSQR